METKDHNNKSVNDPKTCKFYEELEEVLGEKPCVKPIAIMSNLRKKIVISSEENILENLDESSGSSTQNQESPQQKRRKMTRIQRERKIRWCVALLVDPNAREEAKEQRHRETIAESRAAIDTYKNLMEKLIDKL